LTEEDLNTRKFDHFGLVAQSVELRTFKASSENARTSEKSNTGQLEIEAQCASMPVGNGAATSLPAGFDPVAKAIADGQYDIARALLAEMQRAAEERAAEMRHAAEERAGNVLPLDDRRRDRRGR
jgi:hypothetical protein